MTREEVYKLIDGERKYQDEKWGATGRSISDAKTSVAAWIVYMEHHLQQAKNSIYYLKEMGALDEIRKVAALAAACMEHNETSPR